MSTANQDRDDVADITGDSRIEAIAKGLPDASDVYIDPELTSVAEAYVQADTHFVARKMSTAIPVQKRTGQFASFSKADYLRDEMTERADGDESARGGFRQSFKAYACTVYGLHDDVGPQRRANNPNTGNATARYLMRKGLLKTEVLWAATAWGNSIWTTEQTGHATPTLDTQFLTWEDDDAEPIKALELAIQRYEDVAAGFPITDITFHREVWTKFKNHPKVISRLNAGQTPGSGAVMTRQRLADMLEVKAIHVASARKTTSAPGVAEASSTFALVCATEGVLGVHRSAMPSTDDPTALGLMDWTGYAGAGANGQAIFEEPVPNTRGAIRHEIELAMGMKLVSADLGFWLKTPLATPA